MLAVKDGLSEEGDFSRRAEFLKGHLPEAAAGAKHQELSWAPGWRAQNTDSICSKQTGSRFLSLAVTRTQPAQNDNKKFSKSWGKGNQLWLGAQVKRAWGPTCYVLSSVKSFCINCRVCSAVHPITTLHFWKIRCLLGEILFPICFSELL